MYSVLLSRDQRTDITAFYSNHDLVNYDLRSFWVASLLLTCVVCC